MRRRGPFVLLSLLWCLFVGSPAQAVPIELFFDITHDLPEFGLTNPGTISYAGGTAPLVGSNIAVDHIVHTPAFGVEGDLACVNCTLSFSTGPFAGTIPASEPGGLAGYSFSGGGSLQIIGGANLLGLPGTDFLPEGTTLLTGIPTFANVVPDSLSILGPVGLSLFGFQGTLNPDLGSHFGFPAGGTLVGDSRIATTEMSNAPNPFVLSTFTSQGPELEPSHDRVTSVPEPDMFWLTAIGMIGLAGLVAWRQRGARLS